MVVITKGDFIWIEALPNPTSTVAYNNGGNDLYVPIGARVVYAEDERVTILDDEKNERKIGPEQKIRIMHPTSIQGVEDLTQLTDLHEAAILRNLLIRYKEKLIYTYCGKILIIVNPFQSLPNYSPSQASLYFKKNQGELPPHVFAIAEKAYRSGLCSVNGKDQCIIFKGESGSGKSYAAKQVIDYLVDTINPCNDRMLLSQQIKNAISDEADENRKLQSARLSTILLDKWRVVGAPNGERNFNIFYIMIHGLTSQEKFELELNNISDYHILRIQHNQNSSTFDFTRDLLEPNVLKLSDLCGAMKMLMFKDAEILSIFKILAALLHLGNLKYHVTMVDNKEEVDIRDNVNIARISKLLGIPNNVLVNLLKIKHTNLRDESIKIPMNAEQAINFRDELMQSIYSQLFDYILCRINEALYRPQKRDIPNKIRKIGVLDLFGIETVPIVSNSNYGFEQICRNLAHEQIHQYFIDRVFNREQGNSVKLNVTFVLAEYEAQRINWIPVMDFSENLVVLNMLIGAPGLPQSIMSLVDEECLNAKEDYGLLMKLHSTHSSNPNYIKPKSNLSKYFGINHYCGTVHYQIKNFCQKNQNKNNFYEFIESSQFRFLHRIFEENSPKNNNIGTTISTFRATLNSLMIDLENRKPSFVLCLRPNEWKKPMVFLKIILYMF